MVVVSGRIIFFCATVNEAKASRQHPDLEEWFLILQFLLLLNLFILKMDAKPHLKVHKPRPRWSEGH
jgi:hypothetical protein